jgi:hypothetical protein
MEARPPQGAQGQQAWARHTHRDSTRGLRGREEGSILTAPLRRLRKNAVIDHQGPKGIPGGSIAWERNPEKLLPLARLARKTQQVKVTTNESSRKSGGQLCAQEVRCQNSIANARWRAPSFFVWLRCSEFKVTILIPSNSDTLRDAGLILKIQKNTTTRFIMHYGSPSSKGVKHIMPGEEQATRGSVHRWAGGKHAKTWEQMLCLGSGIVENKGDTGTRKLQTKQRAQWEIKKKTQARCWCGSCKRASVGMKNEIFWCQSRNEWNFDEKWAREARQNSPW